MSTKEHILARGRLRRRLRTRPAWARQIRERAGLTQGEMARLVGVTQAAISRYELGRAVPRTGILSRYAEVLGRLEASR